MYDLITKKKNGQELTQEEIQYFIKGYTNGEIPDYQAAALLMAIYFQGLNDKETAILTECMTHSGDVVDLSEIPGIKVDKHSTGGVGDTTTLVITPIVAACGVPIPKMSGRGLGHTGGTLDKLEAIPNFNISLSKAKFLENVKSIGLSIVGQTGNLVPADRKLYALRDVTSTIDNISLIASSIMSKKIASGTDAILLDVKTGSGAFMKSVEDSIELAQTMVNIGEHLGIKTIALITDMNQPLGQAIGNALEVKEALAVLRGEGPQDLTKLCLHLSANMLYLAEKGSLEECIKVAEGAIESGAAFDKFRELVKFQGGDVSVIDDPSLFAKAPYQKEIKAEQAGWITQIDSEQCGLASVTLGAGRQTLEDEIDFSAGIILKKKVGEQVAKGDVLAKIHTSDQNAIERAEEMIKEALHISSQAPQKLPLIYARVTSEGVEKLE